MADREANPTIKISTLHRFQPFSRSSLCPYGRSCPLTHRHVDTHGGAEQAREVKAPDAAENSDALTPEIALNADASAELHARSVLAALPDLPDDVSGAQSPVESESRSQHDDGHQNEDEGDSEEAAPVPSQSMQDQTR